MNEQLQQSVAEILNRAISGMDASVAFMQSELPEVINQLLTWYAVEGAVMMMLGVIIFAAMVKFDHLLLCKLRKDSLFNSEDIVLFYGVLGSSARLMYLIPISMLNLDWLKIWIAPKIWLMEYASTIIK